MPHTIPATGAANLAAGPASRKVKLHETREEEEDDDDDDDDDIEVVTGDGTSSLFMNSP